MGKDSISVGTTKVNARDWNVYGLGLIRYAKMLKQKPKIVSTEGTSSTRVLRVVRAHSATRAFNLSSKLNWTKRDCG